MITNDLVNHLVQTVSLLNFIKFSGKMYLSVFLISSLNRTL